jgi:hypothetical protein
MKTVRTQAQRTPTTTRVDALIAGYTCFTVEGEMVRLFSLDTCDCGATTEAPNSVKVLRGSLGGTCEYLRACGLEEREPVRNDGYAKQDGSGVCCDRCGDDSAQ